jgi:hypothetical protein
VLFLVVDGERFTFEIVYDMKSGKLVKAGNTDLTLETRIVDDIASYFEKTSARLDLNG